MDEIDEVDDEVEVEIELDDNDVLDNEIIDETDTALMDEVDDELDELELLLLAILTDMVDYE